MKNTQFIHFQFKSAFQLFFLIVIIVFASCTGKKNDNNSTENKNKAIPGWISLFDGESLGGWEITDFGTQGVIKVSEGNIILGMGDGCSGVTYTNKFPKMNYEVSLEAKKTSGNDFFCGMTFPVDSSYCSLIVGGWGGPVVGLSTIDRYDGSENETTILKKFEKDIWYHIRLKVTPEKIEVWIDDEKLIDFETAGHELSIRPEVSLSRPFGICTWITTAALRDIRLKKL